MPDDTTPPRSSLFRSMAEIPVPLRVIILGAATAMLVLSGWLSFQRNLDFAWTSVRLAPAFALTHGEPLFSSPGTPPWVMVGYGPLYPVAYLPSTVASAPASAVAIGTVLAHFYILVPVGLLCAACARRLRGDGQDARLHWGVLLLLFALVGYIAPSLNYVLSHVHVDAPALGLFLVACWAVLRADSAGAKAQQWLLIAGIAAGLSAACKVNLIAAAVGCLIWIAWFFGLRAGLKFVLGAVAAFAAVYLVAMLRDGFAAVLLNLRLPGRMPWFTLQQVDTFTPGGTSYDAIDKLRTFLTILGEYVRHYGILALAVLVALPTLNRISAPATRMTKLFLVLTLVMLFASVASVGKSGGDVNSRALVTLPLALAALTAFATLVQPVSRVTFTTAYVAVAAATFVVALSAAANFLRWSVKGSATLVEAHHTIASEPGRWYFPFDPLAHVLAEGKFRPNMDVVHSYAVAGSPVDRDAFRAALPDELEKIAVPPAYASWGIAEIRRLLPEYGRAARQSDLEQHNVISR